MDFFGLVRVTVSWLPRERAVAGQSGTAAVPPPPGRAAAAPETNNSAADESAADDSAAGESAADPAEPTPAAVATTDPVVVATLAAVPVHDPAAEPDVIQALIVLADDVAELAGQAARRGEAEDTLRLVQWRVDQALAGCGVQAVADAGPVDPARHVVAGTRPAGNDSQAGVIAATVRRGYWHGGELIRPQQVIAYTGGPAGGIERGSNYAGED